MVNSRRWAIALGSVGPTPLRAPEAEAALAADTSPEGVRRAAELAAAAARPIDDIRASAAYRRAMVAVLTRRGIESILTTSSSFVLRQSSVAGPSSAGGAPSTNSGGAA
jgi:CO/xanthine dehydrogenase FAD-binding subunit